MKAKKSGLTADWEKFKSVKNEVRIAKHTHFQEMTTENPRLFWRFINSNRKDGTGVHVLKVNDKSITSDQ